MSRLLFALVAGSAFALEGCGFLFPSCQTIPPCPSGQTLCSQQSCSDLHTDRLNCGSCNNVCAPGLVCGPLPDGGAACGCPTAGAVLVNGECIDLQTDVQNCGAPGNACPTGEVCLSGACGCPSGPGGTLTLCGSGATQACVNLQTDAADCGVCGNACGLDATCVAGVCVAADGGLDAGADGGSTDAGIDGGSDDGGAGADGGAPDASNV